MVWMIENAGMEKQIQLELKRGVWQLVLHIYSSWFS
jgi:hypothetical protein